MNDAASASIPQRTTASLAAKRVYDAAFSALGLVALSPLLAAIAVAIKLADRGPVFFRQQRIGRGGTPFTMWKFRTMVVDAGSSGALLTAKHDTRVTRIGRWLRRTKLDELPQLWNVLRGDMSLVGPRPEVPKYVAMYSAEQRTVLSLQPGITDLATLEFRDEETLLSRAANVEDFYVRECMPRKIELNLRYAERASLWEDTKIILRTILPGLGGRGPGRDPI